MKIYHLIQANRWFNKAWDLKYQIRSESLINAAFSRFYFHRDRCGWLARFIRY